MNFDQLYGLIYLNDVLNKKLLDFKIYESLLTVFIPSLLTKPNDEKLDDNQNFQVISILPIIFELLTQTKLDIILDIIIDFKTKLNNNNNFKLILLKQTIWHEWLLKLLPNKPDEENKNISIALYNNIIEIFIDLFTYALKYEKTGWQNIEESMSIFHIFEEKKLLKTRPIIGKL
jgi:hypothetical protein